MTAAHLPRPHAARTPLGVHRLRAPLPGGAATTVHLAEYPLATTEVRVMVLRRAQPLLAWCAARGVGEALVGGFFVRDDRRPLGELRTRGMARRTEPFARPWGAVRACLHLGPAGPVIARRHELPDHPPGDLLQAGPLLVRGGQAAHRDGADPEGFAAASHQFDSDITAGRHPRAALALAGDRLLAVACDGRHPGAAGLTLGDWPTCSSRWVRRTRSTWTAAARPRWWPAAVWSIVRARATALRCPRDGPSRRR